MKKIIIALALVASFIPAQAATGNDLVKWLDEPRGSFNRGMAYGQVQGIAHLLTELGALCAPDGVTNGQAVSLVALVVRANPEVGHLSIPELVSSTLVAKWPCKK